MNTELARNIQREQTLAMRGLIAPVGGGIMVGVVATAGALLAGMLLYQYAMGIPVSRGTPIQKAIMEIVAWGLGSLSGSMAGLHFSRSKGLAVPLCVSLALTAMNGFAFIDMRMPVWFWVVGILVGVVPGLILGLITRRDHASQSMG